MQSPVLRVTFSVICFLLTAVLFLFLLTCFYVSAETTYLSVQESSSQLYSRLIAIGCLTIILSAGSIGLCRIGIRLLHTNIQSLQPPNTKYGFARLLTSILLVTIGLILIFMGLVFPYAIWEELQKSMIAMVLMAALSILMVSVGIVIVRWGNNVKRKAFRKEEIEFLGEKIY